MTEGLSDEDKRKLDAAEAAADALLSVTALLFPIGVSSDEEAVIAAVREAAIGCIDTVIETTRREGPRQR